MTNICTPHCLVYVVYIGDTFTFKHVCVCVCVMVCLCVCVPLPFVFPGACGGALIPEDTPRFLFSPNWPDPYELNLECSWVIRSPDSIVELNLLFMDIEDSATCYFDSLVIRDGERDKAI